MKLLLTQLAVILSVVASAQVGVTTNYTINQVTSEWVGPAGERVDIPADDGFEVQLHYWFRLPQNRIEFQPTVYYHTANIGWASGSTDYRELGFQFEINVYPFDFFGDCGCPTFGKQGPRLQKGFFLQLAPGIARRSVKADNPLPVDLVSTDFQLGAGLGLDIGISNALTLTPIAAVRYAAATFDGSVDGLFTESAVTPDGNENAAGFTSYQLGLQATFRFDTKNY